MAEGLSRYSEEEWAAILAGIDARERARDTKLYGEDYARRKVEFFGF